MSQSRFTREISVLQVRYMCDKWVHKSFKNISEWKKMLGLSCTSETRPWQVGLVVGWRSVKSSQVPVGDVKRWLIELHFDKRVREAVRVLGQQPGTPDNAYEQALAMRRVLERQQDASVVAVVDGRGSSLLVGVVAEHVAVGRAAVPVVARHERNRRAGVRWLVAELRVVAPRLAMGGVLLLVELGWVMRAGVGLSSSGVRLLRHAGWRWSRRRQGRAPGSWRVVKRHFGGSVTFLRKISESEALARPG